MYIYLVINVTIEWRGVLVNFSFLASSALIVVYNALCWKTLFFRQWTVGRPNPIGSKAERKTMQTIPLRFHEYYTMYHVLGRTCALAYTLFIIVVLCGLETVPFFKCFVSIRQPQFTL